VLDGVSPATDIGALQAVAPPNSLFQVASQFNCLESPGPYIAEIADYFHDPTQGPRASISTFPGTLVRHYAAPHVDGSRFVQRSEGPQLDLLAAVCPPGVAAVKSGYLRSADVSDPEAFALELESRFDQIRIGVHDEIEVVLGYDWDGGVDESRTSTIAQVFTSTLALGLYSRAGGDDELSIPICRQLQRAAYLGTLLAAAALGKARVVLTLIGGGVFGNPVPIIWETILWAADDVEPLLHRDLTVVVNGRNLRHAVPSATLSETARARGGAMIRFNGESCTIIPKRSV